MIGLRIGGWMVNDYWVEGQPSRGGKRHRDGSSAYRIGCAELPAAAQPLPARFSRLD